MKFLVWAPFRGRVGTIEAMLEYIRILVTAGHSVTLVQVVDEWNPYIDELRSMPNSPNLVSMFSSPWLSQIGKSNWLYRRDFFFLAMLGAFKMRKIVEELNADYIIAGLITAPLLFFLDRMSKQKVIISIQGYPKFLLKNQGIFYRVENKIREKLWRNMYRQAYAILTMTEHTRALLIERLKLARSHIICVPNPVIPTLERKYGGFDPLLESSNKCSDIVFIGRLDEQKDPELFLAAAEEFTRRRRTARFQVFGSGPLEEKIRRAAQTMELNMEFHGHVEQPWKQIRRGSILLCTSRWEDPGHVVIEAMAFQIPIVMVKRDSGHLEMGYGGRAFIVEANASAIADGLELAERPMDRQKVVESARRYVFNRFTERPLAGFINERC